MKAFGYVRSATGNPVPIEEQRKAVVAMIEAYGYESGGIYADSGAGMTEPGERPGFSHLLGLLGSGDTLFVVDHERISRDPAKLAEILAALAGQNIKVVTLDDVLKGVSDEDLLFEMRRRGLI